MKYSKKEIIQIIKENHRQQIQIHKGLPSEDIITYELTIRDWIDEMELLNWDELSDYYSNYFEIDKEKFKLRESMKPEKKKTIKDLCEFISSKAIKPKLEPIKIFGRTCQKITIFRFLKNKLIQEDIKAIQIRPSSKLKDYMEDFSFILVQETNRINPKILPTIKYEPNELERQNWKLIFGGLILLIADLFFNNWLIAGIGIGLFISGIWTEKISYKIPAKKFEFEGLETFRDLIEKIKREMNTASNNA